MIRYPAYEPLFRVTVVKISIDGVTAYPIKQTSMPVISPIVSRQ